MTSKSEGFLYFLYNIAPKRRESENYSYRYTFVHPPYAEISLTLNHFVEMTNEFNLHPEKYATDVHGILGSKPGQKVDPT